MGKHWHGYKVPIEAGCGMVKRARIIRPEYQIGSNIKNKLTMIIYEQVHKDVWDPIMDQTWIQLWHQFQPMRSIIDVGLADLRW